jgi:hypothetical protein
MVGNVKRILFMVALLLALGRENEATAFSLAPAECSACGDCSSGPEEPGSEARDPFCIFCACCVHAPAFAPCEALSVFIAHAGRSFATESSARPESPDPRDVAHVPKSLLA